MKASNSLTLQGSKKQSFSAIITAQSMQNMINRSLATPARAASFTSSLISAVAANQKLQDCRAETIVAAALRGEAMGLSLPLGQFSLVPYGDTCNFQLSYKGLGQLAIRSGMYEDFDVFDVREGEYKGRDMRTRAPMFEWIEDEDIREATPLAGFYGFYKLKDGFFKSIYWTHEKILKHADRYSKAFSLDKYKSLLAGELDAEDVAKMQNGSPWYGEPLSEGHMKMCKKTLLIQLLNDGKAPLSLEMQTAITDDRVIEAGGITDAEAIFVDAPQISAESEIAVEESKDTEEKRKTKQAAKFVPEKQSDETAEAYLQEAFFAED